MRRRLARGDGNATSFVPPSRKTRNDYLRSSIVPVSLRRWHWRWRAHVRSANAGVTRKVEPHATADRRAVSRAHIERGDDAALRDAGRRRAKTST